MSLEPEFTIKQVAEAMQKSERWVREQIALGTPHQRYGYRSIRFTAAQVAALRAQFEKAPVTASAVTTSRRRRAS